MTVLKWLLEGDPSIRLMTHRDLLGADETVLTQDRDQIKKEGWARRLYDLNDPVTGLWGGGVYSPKYSSTHYTMMDLATLSADVDNPAFQRGMEILIAQMWPSRGLVRKNHYQDLCVSAMVLNLNATGRGISEKMPEIVDYLLDHSFPDGGWNCSWQSRPAPHSSSLHTTLSVLEAIAAYEENGYGYRLDELILQARKAVEFILKKHLFRSVRTGEIIHPDMLKWRFPQGWRYSVIRALDCFQRMGIPHDPRMEEGIQYLIDHADAHGRLKAVAPVSGIYHFRMESLRDFSRFNTLRLLRIVKAYRPGQYETWVGEPL